MVAVAIAGAAVVGAGASIVSGNKAAKAQKDAASQSIDEQRRQYDLAREDNAPWRTAGTGALGKLSSIYLGNGMGTEAKDSLYNEFRATPGYQFQLDEGTKAAERSASARGLLASGAAQKAVARYAGGLADQTYGQYVGQLNTMAGLGQAATNATTQAGQNAANNISNAYTNAGNARASSYANTGSAINSGLNNLASVYAYQQGGGFSSNAGRNSYGIIGSENIY